MKDYVYLQFSSYLTNTIFLVSLNPFAFKVQK